MAFLEELGKTITKVGEATAQKTKEVAGITKANAKILDVQNKLDKAYAEVGKKYVKLHPANEEEEMQAAVETVYSLEDQLKELRRQLQNFKGTVKCEVCDAECDADAAFCSKCGAKLKKAQVVVDSEGSEAVDEEMAEETVEEAEEADIEDSVE